VVTLPTFLLYNNGVILQDIRQNDRSLPQPLWLQLKLCKSDTSSSTLVHCISNSVLLPFPIRNGITLPLWLGQGEGFFVEFLDYPGPTTLVK
jgi:hypothetical protein